jgi:hypothetical protein
MEEPPIMLDGARVIEFAVLDSTVPPAGHVSMVVEGVSLDLTNVSGLVIAENPVEGGVFLLYCNHRWETVAAGHHNELEAARASAEHACSAVAGHWTRYRELSAEERAEVETTRAFLREMAAEYPNE